MLELLTLIAILYIYIGIDDHNTFEMGRMYSYLELDGLFQPAWLSQSVNYIVYYMMISINFDSLRSLSWCDMYTQQIR